MLHNGELKGALDKELWRTCLLLRVYAQKVYALLNKF
jgi:hypothetical protein